MFSTDQNIDKIVDLVETAKKQGNLMLEQTKYNVIEKVVRILTATFLFLAISLIILLMLIYLSFAGAYAIGSLIGSDVMGFLCISGIYLLVLLLVICKRKAWIEKPLVRFFSSILLD